MEECACARDVARVPDEAQGHFTETLFKKITAQFSSWHLIALQSHFFMVNVHSKCEYTTKTLVINIKMLIKMNFKSKFQMKMDSFAFCYFRTEVAALKVNKKGNY